jgi:hypothetical protein
MGGHASHAGWHSASRAVSIGSAIRSSMVCPLTSARIRAAGLPRLTSPTLSRSSGGLLDGRTDQKETDENYINKY